jgi:NMD protein affecting ribosome stability and mRNA decay
LVTKFCDLCGQPASRIHPELCAECYYKYWERVSREAGRLMTVW